MKDYNPLKEFNARLRTSEGLDYVIRNKRSYHPIIVDKCVGEMQRRQKKKNIKKYVNSFVVKK